MSRYRNEDTSIFFDEKAYLEELQEIEEAEADAREELKREEEFLLTRKERHD